MENTNQLDDFLKDKLSLATSNIEAPDISFLIAARKAVAKRKSFNHETDDVFSIVAAFLNMKIKLYHAVIASVCLALVIFFFTKTEKSNNIESNSSQYVSNIASVRSSTVLSSIRTFAVKN